MRPSGRQASSLAALFVLTSCSAVGHSIVDLADEINATLDTAHTTIAVGDTLHVTFPFKSDWDHQARVRPDGVATFHLIDDVQVAGLTLADLDTRLTELYREKRQNQEDIELTVDVPSAGGGGGASTGSTIGEDTGRVAYIVGEVRQSGPIVLAGRSLTLIEAIGAAGGHLKPTANLRNTILMRRLAASGEMRSWRLDADIYLWGSLPPIFLQPRDIVFVPNTAIDDVNIWIDQYIRKNLPFPYLIPRTQPL